MYFVYILYSFSIHKFYVGQTSDIQSRVQRHNQGGEKYTSKGIPWTLLWSTAKGTRKEAINLEQKLKNLSQERLFGLMMKYNGDLKVDVSVIERIQAKLR